MQQVPQDIRRTVRHFADTSSAAKRAGVSISSPILSSSLSPQLSHWPFAASPCTVLKQPTLSVFGRNEILSSFVLTAIDPFVCFVLVLLFVRVVAI
jgi:hypothetical protein